MLIILWLHVVAVSTFALAEGFAVGHTALECSALAAAALFAKYAPAGQRIRSSAVCLGLMTASGLLVHFSGGYIEFHFHFFVMIVVLSLYVDWVPFLLAVSYVLIHHGILGVVDPSAVYNHPDAIAHPWKWAGIHAGFVLAAASACIFTWRIGEVETHRRHDIERVTEAALARLPLPGLLDELLSRITSVLRVDASSIWLLEEGELALRAAHGIGLGGHDRLPVDHGLHGRIISARAPAAQIVGAGTPEPTSGVQAVAGVPLLVEGEVIGVLDVASSTPREFSMRELDLLQLVADRMGPAIDRARLYEHEHQIAETLQRSLLPQRLPNVRGADLVARYLPAGERISVGGDWYDAIELPRSLAIVMGDVVGHGSEAAALMGQLRTGLRAYATEGHPPAEVVGRVNQLLYGLHRDGMATLLYFDLDLASWRGRLVTAGHPPPVLLGADGACRFVERSRGAPLGAVARTVYPCDEVALASGSTLIFYTDGLIERRGTPLQQSMRALLERVGGLRGRAADAICDDLIAGALADGPLADDAAVLALQRPGENAGRTRRTADQPPA